MRKLNVVFIQGDKKDDAILKIKDDSLTITTSDDNLVKIPYSNIKDYSYQELDEQLSIIQYGGSMIRLGMKKDQQLINQLKEASKQKNEEQVKTIQETPNITQNEEQHIANNVPTNDNSNPLIAKIIACSLVVIVGIFILSKMGFFNSLSALLFNSINGTYTHYATGAKIIINGDDARLELDGETTYLSGYNQYTDGGLDFITFYYSDGSSMTCNDFSWAVDPYIDCGGYNFNKE